MYGPSVSEERQNLRFKGGIQRIRPDPVLSAGVRAIGYCIPVLLREEIVLVRREQIGGKVRAEENGERRRGSKRNMHNEADPNS